MRNQDKIKQIEQLILPLLNSQDVELIDIELRGNIGNQVLRVYVDVEGGIDLNHCAKLSSRISDLLDIEDIILGRYRLEVSSPGLDRPLKTINDFRRNKGKPIRINFLDGNEVEACIKEVNGSNIYLEDKNNQYKFPISSVKFAKIKLQW